jgi:hypothetical protein
MVLAATGFTQHLNPLNSILGSTLVALLPLALLLVLLAVMRVTAWLAVIIGAIVTIIMAITIWDSPVGPTFHLAGRDLVHLAGTAPGLDRRRAVGQQHLHQRAIRRVPVRRRRAAAHARAAAAEVIRHNFGWTLVILGYLILIGVFYYYVLPDAMRL